MTSCSDSSRLGAGGICSSVNNRSGCVTPAARSSLGHRERSTCCEGHACGAVVDVQLVQACRQQCQVRCAGHLHFIDKQQHLAGRSVVADFVS